MVNIGFPIRGEAESIRHARGRYGEGEAHIRIRSGLGPINVRLAEADEGEVGEEKCDEQGQEDHDEPPVEDPFTKPTNTHEANESGRPTRRLDEDDDLPFGLDDD